MSDDFDAALDHSIGVLLRFRGVLDPTGIAAGLGMSVSEALALRHLSGEAMTQSELGSLLGLEKSTVSRLVDGLLERGWATRAAVPGNGRVRTVTITGAGRKAADRVGEAMRRRHHRMFEQLSEAERDALSVALPALARVLAATERE